MIGRFKEILRTAGGEWIISLTTKADPRALMETLKDVDIDINVKKASKKRTKTANDFCWAMCTDIGNAMRPPIPKEEVYRTAISDVGVSEMLQMREEAIPLFREIWAQRGIGWFTKVIDYGLTPGWKVIFAYYGTSTYTADEMSLVLEYLKQEMVSMELPIPVSKEEEERMLSSWQKAYSKRKNAVTSADEKQTLNATT